jgi:hypothetical protein
MAGRSTTSDANLRAVLGQASPEVRERVTRLRKLVRSAAPRATERGIRGWGVIGYEQNGLFCSIMPLKKYASLFFYRGTELPDPQRLLEGSGKRLRHVKIRRPGDIRVGPLKQLVRAALKLQSK